MPNTFQGALEQMIRRMDETGTQLNDTGNPAAYWNTSNDAHLASAKSYIPESTWNDSSYTFFGSSNNL